MAVDHELGQRLGALTTRELEVLRLLAHGHDAKSIAAALSITINSVNDRLREVRRKLSTSSSREAARLLAAHEGSVGSKKIAPKEIGIEEGGTALTSPTGPGVAPAMLRRPLLLAVGGFMIAAFALGALLTFAGPDTRVPTSSDSSKGSNRHVAIFSDVPITYDGTYLRVPARLGAIETDMILDTAANSTVISPATRDALNLSSGTPVDVVGAGGQAKYEAVEIPKLWVGDLENSNVGAVVLDLARFSRASGRPYGGILSNAFLRAYDAEVNLPASRLRLYQPSPSPLIHGYQASRAVPNLAEDPGWVVLEILINGRPVRAIVDTAAPASVLNWAAARSTGVTPSTAGVRRRAQPTSGLGTNAAETFEYNFRNVAAGRTRFQPGDLRIADLKVFEALGLKDRPAMLLGLDILRQVPMLISYSSKRVYFGEARRNELPRERAEPISRIVPAAARAAARLGE